MKIINILPGIDSTRFMKGALRSCESCSQVWLLFNADRNRYADFSLRSIL